MEQQEQNPQELVPPAASIPSNDEYQNLEIGFIRKRDSQLMYVRLADLFHAFKTADFINNEITIEDEVCQLNSFQKKIVILTFSLNVIKASSGGDGSYTIDGVTYTDNHEFQIPQMQNIVITLTADQGSGIGTVVDGGGNSYEVNNNAVTIPVAAAMTVTITFVGK
jgi:hypothetical protein